MPTSGASSEASRSASSRSDTSTSDSSARPDAADPYLERENLQSAEFYALVLFATAGMGVLASAQELLTAFIGLEMSSISSYILAGYRRDSFGDGLISPEEERLGA